MSIEQIIALYGRELLLMLLALVGSHCAAYLLGEQQGQKFYWWRNPEEPKPRRPKPKRDPRPSLDPERLNDERLELLADKLELQREVEHQEALKQRHIKEKKKLKEQIK